MDFDRRTSKLIAGSRHGRITIGAFEDHFPGVACQLRLDANAPWLDLWGQSFNRDEFEHKAIVDAKILSVLGRLANTKIRQADRYHAGLIHTYGYLFSQLKTRFGYKRERWTTGIMEKGLGLPKGSLCPIPPNGTLLSNATYLLSRVSLPASVWKRYFRRDAEQSPLSQFDWRRLTGHRLIESVERAGPYDRVTFYVDTFDFLRSVNGCRALLVYSCQIGRRSDRKLITCFPISSRAKQELVTLADKNATPIRPHFNAAVPDFPEGGVMGRRRLVEL